MHAAPSHVSIMSRCVPACGGRYLGLYATEIEAAQAYDRESVSRRGLEAITNFDLGEYARLLSAEVHIALVCVLISSVMKCAIGCIVPRSALWMHRWGPCDSWRGVCLQRL